MNDSEHLASIMQSLSYAHPFDGFINQDGSVGIITSSSPAEKSWSILRECDKSSFAINPEKHADVFENMSQLVQADATNPLWMRILTKVRFSGIQNGYYTPLLQLSLALKKTRLFIFILATPAMMRYSGNKFLDSRLRGNDKREECGNDKREKCGNDEGGKSQLMRKVDADGVTQRAMNT